MKFIETLNTSLGSLLHNKVRSFLTMLGVVIGVFSIVTLVALVRGVQNYVQDQFNELGAGLLFVSPGRGGFSGDPALRYSNNKLTIESVENINTYASSVVSGVSPSIFASKNVKQKGRSYYSSIEGVNEEHADIVKLKITDGRRFTEADINSSSRVAILGHNVKKELFGINNPIDKTVTIEGKSFKVIGYMPQRSQDFDEEILIPYTTMSSVLEIKTLSYIYVYAKDGVDPDYAKRQVEIALFKNMKRDDFSVFTQKDLLSSVNEILGILSIGLASIAGISLLVGGIGIMNIMLVSVTERISEVGLRKALGATRQNIATQFMTEAILLSSLGGILGLSLSWLATLVAQQFFRAEIPWWSIILAMGFSLGVGVTFGTYPAVKASKLEPIEALRYE